MRVGTGRVVTMEYAVRLASGEVVEKSRRDAPVQYLHGAGMLLPSLEDALEDVEEGVRKRFVLAPGQAYGDRDEARVLSLPRNLFQDDGDLHPGARMAARMADGDLHPLTVRDVKRDRVVVDLNHPLAGQALHFDVVVREVRTAGPEELFSGKPREVERV
jgi:FKBP-type peptidyl-prolyl cis-trans isomerase SlyD